MKRERIALLAVYICVLGFQVLWHWSLSGSSAFARSLLRFYLYRGPRWSTEGWLDLILPGFLLGPPTGWIGWRWGAAKLSLCVFVAGLAVVAITPVYLLFVDKSLVWFWTGSVAALAVQVLKAWALIGFLACFGYKLHKGIVEERAAKGLPQDGG